MKSQFKKLQHGSIGILVLYNFNRPKDNIKVIVVFTVVLKVKKIIIITIIFARKYNSDNGINTNSYLSLKMYVIIIYL